MRKLPIEDRNPTQKSSDGLSETCGVFQGIVKCHRHLKRACATRNERPNQYHLWRKMKHSIRINARLCASGQQLEREGAWSKFLATFLRRTDARDSLRNLYKTDGRVRMQTCSEHFRAITVVQERLETFLCILDMRQFKKTWRTITAPNIQLCACGCPFWSCTLRLCFRNHMACPGPCVSTISHQGGTICATVSPRY